jgi:predicted transcriptional regulator
MSTPVVTIEPGTSLLEAAKLMAKHQIGALVVTLEKSEFGVITERDFLRFVSEGKRRPDEALVAEVMSAPAVTVPSFETIEAASKILEERAFRRLPVVDEGRLVGMVTLTSLMSALRSRVIAELETRFAELEKTNRLMVGRELRMVELKKQLQTRTPADAGGGKQ